MCMSVSLGILKIRMRCACVTCGCLLNVIFRIFIRDPTIRTWIFVRDSFDRPVRSLIRNTLAALSVFFGKSVELDNVNWWTVAGLWERINGQSGGFSRIHSHRFASIRRYFLSRYHLHRVSLSVPPSLSLCRFSSIQSRMYVS